jgi:hypothetical protein
MQVLYGVNQRLRVEDVDSPLCDVRPVKTVLLVVLTGDRGLCGGYNNFIIKRVRSLLCWGVGGGGGDCGDGVQGLGVVTLGDGVQELGVGVATV